MPGQGLPYATDLGTNYPNLTESRLRPCQSMTYGDGFWAYSKCSGENVTSEAGMT